MFYSNIFVLYDDFQCVHVYCALFQEDTDTANAVSTDNVNIVSGYENDYSGIFGPPMIMPSFIQPVTMQGELNLWG